MRTQKETDLQARVEELEAAIYDALPCLDEHDPEVAAICRAATDKIESGGSWQYMAGWCSR